MNESKEQTPHQVGDHKVYFHDKIMAKTVLRLIPQSVKPNHITVLRFLLTPVVVLLMMYQEYYIGLFAFLFVAFTDAIDGSLARTRNQITDWGRIYDPVADKILIGSMIFVVVFRYIEMWTAILIVAIEIVIIAASWYRKIKGKKVEANIWGKIKMILQVFGVVMLLMSIVFDLASLLPFASGALYLAIAFAVVSLLTYGI